MNQFLCLIHLKGFQKLCNESFIILQIKSNGFLQILALAYLFCHPINYIRFVPMQG
jgi:hypothetical protein